MVVEPEREMDKLSDVEAVASNFTRDELVKMCIALGLTHQVTEKAIDFSIPGLLLKVSLEKKWLSLDDFPTDLKYWEERIRMRDKPVRKEGEKWGLIHGHYRRFTLAHMIGLLVAQRNCDKLTVLLESSDRSLKFKGEKAEISDEDRGDILMLSGLANDAILIVGEGYDNSFYRTIIEKTKPDVYFGNQEWSDERMKEGQRRADSVGAEFVVLPEFKGLHLSDLKDSFY